MEKVKKFFSAIDQYLPADVFTMIIEDIERDAPFTEKIKEYLP